MCITGVFTQLTAKNAEQRSDVVNSPFRRSSRSNTTNTESSSPEMRHIVGTIVSMSPTKSPVRLMVRCSVCFRVFGCHVYDEQKVKPVALWVKKSIRGRELLYFPADSSKFQIEGIMRAHCSIC